MKFLYLVAATLAAMPLASQALVIPHKADVIEALNKLKDSKLSDPFITSDRAAPFVTSEVASQNIIEDSYIVVFKDDIDDSSIMAHHLFVEAVHDEHMSTLRKRDSQDPFLLGSLESGLRHVFAVGPKFRGYSGRFQRQTIDAIRQHPAVAFVEHDSRVFANEFELEKSAPWGLARISHRETLSLGSFNKYLFDNEGGEGVTAYVVDTGTNIEHVDFEGRARWGKTIPTGDIDIDGNGHGSHCSGTIAGKKYGVAKKAEVVAVKVLGTNGSGTMSDVIKGVEFVVASHLKDQKKKGSKGSTANMSLGGGKSPSLDIAVNAAVKAGVHFAVAAGNDNADACNYSPAAAENAVTVGATALYDERAYFSNYGKCVDIFAPGVNILSTYTGSKTAVATLSGTSMASPHICGLLTYFLSLQPDSDSEYAINGAITPEQLKKHLIAFGTKDIITELDDESPNVLAYNGGGQNLSEFWHPSDFVEEERVKILPIDSTIVEESLKHLTKDFDELFDSIRSGLGLGF